MPSARSTPGSSTSQHNYFSCVLNGLFTRLGMNITHPSMVLSIFARMLGASNTLIGLIPAIRFSGWFLPQFLVASWIQPQPRKMPISVAFESVRIVVYGALAILTYTLGLFRPHLLLVVFFVVFSISRVTTGTGALARLDAIGKIIPPSRRASFFAMRNFFGGTLVFGAGFLVRYVLDTDRGQPFPLNNLQIAHIPGAGHNIRREQFEPYVEAVRAFLRIKGREKDGGIAYPFRK